LNRCSGCRAVGAIRGGCCRCPGTSCIQGPEWSWAVVSGRLPKARTEATSMRDQTMRRNAALFEQSSPAVASLAEQARPGYRGWSLVPQRLRSARGRQAGLAGICSPRCTAASCSTTTSGSSRTSRPAGSSTSSRRRCRSTCSRATSAAIARSRRATRRRRDRTDRRQCLAALFSAHALASADFAHSPATWRVATLSRFHVFATEIMSTSVASPRSS